MKHNIVIAIASISLGIAQASEINAQYAIAPPLLANSTVEVGKYSIQPPQGYIFKPIPNAPSPAYGYAFVGPSRSDGTFGQLTVTYLPLANSETTDVEYFTQKRLNTLRQYYSDWLQSGLEIVSINGLSFHRVRWVGTHLKRKLPMQGVVYVTVHKNEVIYLSSRDLTVHQSDLNRANTAAMTFSP